MSKFYSKKSSAHTYSQSGKEMNFLFTLFLIQTPFLLISSFISSAALQLLMAGLLTAASLFTARLFGYSFKNLLHYFLRENIY
jgi:hypothetical protein